MSLVLYFLCAFLLADIVCLCTSIVVRSKDFIVIFIYAGLFILSLMFLSMIVINLFSLGW